ncbi:unnamed protein product [Adineta steineri]|uniref:Uncharacterized protein n=1 Tax=Adineta steineri TaxID=433720 RepID=A0A815DFQ5_9BILA|nr:unnamed protein product [Adineta steineri]CAF1539961.1 unnamed protein product [Adineta steineri]
MKDYSKALSYFERALDNKRGSLLPGHPYIKKNRSRYNKTTLSTIFDHNEEKWYIVTCQVLVPFMIAGFGMVAAGLVLERVKELNVFKEITKIYILIPALLGLKGNLELALASRLSTQTNIGNMDKKLFSSVSTASIISLALVAIQASRLSTTLHQQGKLGEFQEITQYHPSKYFPNPYKIFCSTINGSNPSCEDFFQGDIEGNTSYLQTPCLANLRGRQGLFLATHCIKLIAYSPEPNSIQYIYRTCSRDEGDDNGITRTSHCGFIKLDWINPNRRLRGCLHICDKDACNQAFNLCFSRWNMIYSLILLRLFFYLRNYSTCQ